MLGTYRRALELPGAIRFSSTGFVARLPIAMVGLAIVLYISTESGSYAQAGVLAGTFQIAAAFGAIVTSRWTDRFGQARLLPPLALVNSLALVAFVAAVQAGLPVVVQAALIGLAGAAQPAIGSMVRARWAALAPDGDRLRSAFALESIVDEFIFTLGPLITSVLAFQEALPLPLIVGAVIGLVGAVALALQRRTQPVPSRHIDRNAHGGGALRQPGLLLVVVSAFGIGGVFGTYEVAVVAFTKAQGSASASGLVLGLWAFGSMVGGIVFGARHWSMPLHRQVVVLPAVLAVVLIPAPFIGSIPVLAATTTVGGMAVAPALIAGFSITERLVPSSLLTEGLTWANSGLALGFSAGSFAGGVLVDARGTSPAFALAIACAVFAAVVTATGQRTLSRASTTRAQPGPVTALNSEPVPGPTAGGVVDDPSSGGESPRSGSSRDLTR